MISNLPLFNADAVRQHRTWFLILGIVLVILGVLAIYYDLIATVISVLVFGWVLVIAGVAEIVHGFQTHRWGGFFLHLLPALLYLVVGALFLGYPLLGATALTLFLGAFFLVEGVFEIIGTLRIRPPHMVWPILAGVVTALLGVLLWVQWPSSGLFFIGLAVGITLIFRGWGWIMLAAVAGRISKDLGAGAAHA